MASIRSNSVIATPVDRDPMARIAALGEHAMRALGLAVLIAFGMHGVVAEEAKGLNLELYHWSQDLAARIGELFPLTVDIEDLKPDPPKEEPKEEKKDEPPPPAPLPAPLPNARPAVASVPAAPQALAPGRQ